MARYVLLVCRHSSHVAAEKRRGKFGGREWQCLRSLVEVPSGRWEDEVWRSLWVDDGIPWIGQEGQEGQEGQDHNSIRVRR